MRTDAVHVGSVCEVVMDHRPRVVTVIYVDDYMRAANVRWQEDGYFRYRWVPLSDLTPLSFTFEQPGLFARIRRCIAAAVGRRVN